MNRESIRNSIALAGLVKRYHTWPMLRQQTVAEHCWRVATIYCEIFEIPRGEILYYCLHHDSGELYAGDVPFTVKQKMPLLGEAMEEAEQYGLDNLKITLPALTPSERVRVKICDLLEMYETGMIEYNMGNQYAAPIIADTRTAALKLAKQHDQLVHVNPWLKSRGTKK